MKAILLIINGYIVIKAETWEPLQNSGEYYSGVGVGEIEQEADRNALANLISHIAVHISSDFTQIDNETSRNGNIDHELRVPYY